MHESEEKVKLLSRVRLLVTPWTAAHQAPPSMGFSRQEYWSGVPSPSPYLVPTTCQVMGTRYKEVKDTFCPQIFGFYSESDSPKLVFFPSICSVLLQLKHSIHGLWGNTADVYQGKRLSLTLRNLILAIKLASKRWNKAGKIFLYCEDLSRKCQGFSSKGIYRKISFAY